MPQPWRMSVARGRARAPDAETSTTPFATDDIHSAPLDVNIECSANSPNDTMRNIHIEYLTVAVGCHGRENATPCDSRNIRTLLL